MKQVNDFPCEVNFVAVWEVMFNWTPTLFSVSLHWNEEEQQYYLYDPGSDMFLAQCDHGYTQRFLDSRAAKYFVA